MVSGRTIRLFDRARLSQLQQFLSNDNTRAVLLFHAQIQLSVAGNIAGSVQVFETGNSTPVFTHTINITTADGVGPHQINLEKEITAISDPNWHVRFSITSLTGASQEVTLSDTYIEPLSFYSKQANWTQTDSNAVDFIQNKPSLANRKHLSLTRTRLITAQRTPLFSYWMKSVISIRLAKSLCLSLNQ